jgi:hypothetical protein
MAIGKVGSFATVEPAIVDFGAMAAGTIDKMQAQRQAKVKAKDARQKEIEKIGGIGALKNTNIKGLNQGLYQIYTKKRGEFAEAARLGDTEKMRRLQEDVFSMNNVVDNIVKQYDFYLKNEDKFDPDYLNRSRNFLDNIDIANSDVREDENGRVLFTVYGDADRTQVLAKDIAANEIMDINRVPYKFNEEAMVKSFIKNYPLDEIEGFVNAGSLIGTQKEIKLENNPRVLSAIEDKAMTLTNDSTAMAFFGKTIGKFESDARGFTNEEKEQAKAFFEKKLKDAYKAELDLAVQQKRTARAGKAESAPYGTPQSSYEYSSLPTLSGNQKYTSMAIKPIGFGSFSIKSVVYDPVNNKIYPVVSRPISEGATESARGESGSSITAREGATLAEAQPIIQEGERKVYMDMIRKELGLDTEQQLKDILLGL